MRHAKKSTDWSTYTDTPRKLGKHGGPKVDRKQKRIRKAAEHNRRRNRR